MGTEGQGITPANLYVVLAPYIPALRRLVERKIPVRLRRIVSVDDVLQEVWIAICRCVENFHPDGPSAIERWVATIVSSKLADALRHARRRKRGGSQAFMRRSEPGPTPVSDLLSNITAPGTTPSRECARTEAADLLEAAIAALNEARRAVVLMHYRDGLACSEIARRMGRSEAAVCDLLFRSRRQMHIALGSATKYFTDARTDAGKPETSGAQHELAQSNEAEPRS